MPIDNAIMLEIMQKYKDGNPPSFIAAKDVDSFLNCIGSDCYIAGVKYSKADENGSLFVDNTNAEITAKGNKFLDGDFRNW